MSGLDNEHTNDDETHDEEQSEDRKREYLARDCDIIKLLLSLNKEDQELGMHMLMALLSWFARILKGIALRSDLPVSEILLDDSGHLRMDVIDDLWQHALKCLLENIRKKDFEFKGFLLAYLVKIAWRALARQWIKQFQLHNIDVDTLLTDPGLDVQETQLTEECMTELDHAIKEFCETLSDKNRMILMAGLLLKLEHNGKRISSQKLAEEVREAGFPDDSTRDTTIARQFNRLKKRLGEFLRKQGYYHV